MSAIVHLSTILVLPVRTPLLRTPMSKDSPAYEIYSKQLFGRGYGYPLWHPEPNEEREIQIGDVGYLYQGSFWRIFNTTLAQGHEANEEFGVPDHYDPFHISRLLSNVQKGVLTSSLLSTSVKSVEATADAST